MHHDPDTIERLTVICNFFLEAYKIVMGTMLVVFVPHKCGSAACTLTESMRPETSSGIVALSINGVSLASLLALYYVELRRENWCIRHLDIDPNEPDLNLANVAPPTLLHTLNDWNEKYWKCAVATLAMTVVNSVTSGLFLFTVDGNTATYVSFVLLLLMKVYRSHSVAKAGHAQQSPAAYSAYMREPKSYNVLDADEYQTELVV